MVSNVALGAMSMRIKERNVGRRTQTRRSPNSVPFSSGTSSVLELCRANHYKKDNNGEEMGCTDTWLSRFSAYEMKTFRSSQNEHLAPLLGHSTIISPSGSFSAISLSA